MVVCIYVHMYLVSFGYVTLVLHLARGSGSIMGLLFTVLLARGSDPYMMSLFSKCTSCVGLLVGPPLPDRSKESTQAKRGTLVLQVGGWVDGPALHHLPKKKHTC